MRSRRTSAVLLSVLVALGLTAAPAPASSVRGGRSWTLAGHPCRLVATSGPNMAVAAGEACDGVRPGAPVFTPVGQCTLNFLWRGTDGRNYIGTAGHCLLEGTNLQKVVYQPGKGPSARDGDGHPIGEFAYGALDNVSDFALIRLAPGIAASPEMCRFGGPTGMNADPISVLTPLHHVGRGSLTGSVVPARTQLAIEGDDIRVVTGLGVASPGDSGSPVVGLDGRAVGVVVATGPTLPLAPTGLLVFSVRIAPEMGRASAALGVGFELVTSATSPGILLP